MVKLYSIAILFKNASNGKTNQLAKAINTDAFSFFQRNGAIEFMGFTSQIVTERTSPCTRNSIKEDVYLCHCYVRPDGLAGVVIADEEYPSRVAHSLITKVLDDFTEKVPSGRWAAGSLDNIEFGVLKGFLDKFQNPAEADSLTKLQGELDETKIILHENIDKILDRGEKLDDLVAKSEGLSTQSKAFYTTARKTNSCCAIL